MKLFNSFSGIFFSFLLLLDAAKSETYTVGDEDEWSSGTNYVAWSEKYKFMVNDTLVFKYVKGQHNVYEVTQSTYQSCDTSSGVLAKYGSGNDEVKLNEARKYWFVCDQDGHCLGGMRFGITVTKAGNGSQTTNSAPNPSSASKMLPLCSLVSVGIFSIKFLVIIIIIMY